VPTRIGVVASLESAALRDVLQVLGRRCPRFRCASRPLGAGVGAARRSPGLEALGRAGGVDVILLVRGGGSLEDLQAFNTERWRAPSPPRRSGVSGVGHEIDVTIADLAADLRAPTPSAAAELAAPDRVTLAAGLRRDARHLERAAPQRSSAPRRASPRCARRWRCSRPGRAWRPSAGGSAPRSGSAAASSAHRSRRAAAGSRSSARSSTRSRLSRARPRLRDRRRARDGAVVLRADQVAAGDALTVRVAEAENRRGRHGGPRARHTGRVG